MSPTLLGLAMVAIAVCGAAIALWREARRLARYRDDEDGDL